MNLPNTVKIMIAEIHPEIERMKEAGKTYPEIKEAIMQRYGESHWLVTDKVLREQAIAGALLVYAMDDEQREAVREIQNLTGIRIL